MKVLFIDKAIIPKLEQEDIQWIYLPFSEF